MAHYFEQFGLVFGVLLLVLVGGTAFALARKAARSVEQFREEHHESFRGTGRL